MPAESPCPEPDVLQRLALNQASPTEAFQVSKHLVRCKFCAEMVRALKDASQVLASMPAGTAVGGVAGTGVMASQPAPVAPAKPDLASERTIAHPPPAAESSGRRTTPVDADNFLSPPLAPDEMGRMGPYRVLKILGSGGMGVVFQAEDPQLGRLIALKAMRPALIGDDVCRKRFMQEARAAAAVEHEHIVTVYRVDEDRGFPYLTMQYLHGENLEDRLWREKRLPLDEVVRIAREVASGLAAAHDQGLIHRDIKPSNIWLESSRKSAAQPSNRGGKVKILDFGLARMMGDTTKQLTQTGFVVGTAGYIAPEQARGLTVDLRCDLFSLGCVLYEMCTGTVPFQGTDAMSRLTALAVEQPRNPRELNPNVPPKLAEVVTWLLNKAPDDRPRSAHLVVDALTEVEALLPSADGASKSRSRPATAPRPSLPDAPPPATSTNSLQTLLIVLGCAVLGVAGYKLVTMLLTAN